MLLFYIRHGDPIYDPDSLTPLGERQAEALARRLALYGIDEIYASSSNRAMLTAKPTCELLHKEMTVLDWCNEKFAGEDFFFEEDGSLEWAFQHQKYRERFVSDEIRSMGRDWHKAFSDKTFKKGLDRVQKETDAFMKSFGYEHDLERNLYNCVRENKSRIALFAHQGFGMVFLSCLLDIPYPMFSTHFDFTHTGMTVIDFSERRGAVVPRVLQLSGDSHIYRDGLPTKYQNEIYF